PRQKVHFASVEMAKNAEDVRQRLPLLLAGSDRASEFLWKLFSEVFVYTAGLVGEICDTVVEVDRAMRWGYGRELGPFEACDVLGVEKVVERLRQERRPVPENVERMLASGARSFYRQQENRGEVLDRFRSNALAAAMEKAGAVAPTPGEGGSAGRLYFDLRQGAYQPLEGRPAGLILKDLKRERREVKCNAGASLIDLGEGVLGVEFHSKMNAIGEDQVSMMMAGLKELASNFDAMVIANQGENFSVGANLVMVL